MKVKKKKTAKPWLVDMNEAQLEVINHGEGPCAVLACAGSGKTRSLVHRIAKLVHDGVSPERILAVTFSKKANGVMERRLKKLAVTEAHVSTWHSLCLQILREDDTEYASWTIDDTDLHRTIVKESMGYRFVDWAAGDLGEVIAYIGLCKANLESPTSVEAGNRAGQMFGSQGGPLAKQVYLVSQKLLEERELLTFDDFLVYVYKHLKIEKNRLPWARRWDYILQDEMQDANWAQTEIARLLAKDHRNYMVVGDLNQAIFAFRGSKPEILASFKDEWQSHFVDMNKNYRSGRAIVAAANGVIRPALLRVSSDMLAERDVDGSVHVLRSDNQDDEAAEFVDWIRNIIDDGGAYNDVVALYRTNAQSRPLEETLLASKIPYQVVGGSSFYNRREVRNLLSYVRVASGKGDVESIKRCINAPFRFLGKAFVERLMAKAARTQPPINWMQLVETTSQEEGIQNRQKKSAQDWGALITTLGTMHKGPASEALKHIVTQTNYIEWLKRDEGKENVESSHVANVQELLRISERFATVGELLKYIVDMQNMAKKNKDDKTKIDRVTLMSCHRSKGLEYPHVFIAGVNEGLLPHARGILEEERRLAYVAFSRAQDSLIVSYVDKLPTTREGEIAAPSRFITDAGLKTITRDSLHPLYATAQGT